jgi:hypothetical protein
MMKRLFTLLAAAACWTTVGAGAVRAQTQDQSQQPAQNQGQQQTPDQTQQQPAPDQGQNQSSAPIPAYRSPLAGAADNEEDETNPEILPDNRALTGVQALGLGMRNEHSYWQPHANIFLSVDSNPSEATGNGSWGTWTSLSAGVDVHKISANNDLELNYIGGGMVSNNTDASNGVIQGLSFSDRILFHRWALSVIEDLNYVPESAFGFGGLGAALPGGGSLPGGGGLLGPGQSLLTGRGQNLTDVFDAEADISLTGRTSLTLVGGYSTLNYFDSDLLNYGTANVRAGYNYQLNRKDTLGVDYTFSDTNYSNFHQSIVDHMFQVAYGHRVTGRLAFQIAAGPEIATFQVPIATGTGGTGGAASGPTTNVYWSLGTNLTYALQRTAFGLVYNHGVSGGSGILAGSQGDTVSGSITRRMTRLFSSGIAGGYSRNRGLAAVNTTTPSASQTYDYWFGGGNFSYPLGRTLALTFTYQLQYQDSGTAFCVATPCVPTGTSVLRNTISVGLSWSDRPRRF